MKRIIKNAGIFLMIAMEIYFMVIMRKHREQSEKSWCNKHNKSDECRHLLALWMYNQMNHKYIADYLATNNIRNIAIYGITVEADLLDKELEHSAVGVTCFMETNSVKYSYRNKPMLDIEKVKNMEEVDAIIVAAVFAFESIEENIRKACNKRVISLSEVVYGVKKMGEQS